MRQSLKLESISLPHYDEAFPVSAAKRLEEKYATWVASDFAGFRRMLDKGSPEYPNFPQIKAVAEAAKIGSTGKALTEFVLLGTGGSSLGGEALIRALVPSLQKPRFHFMDNNDPDWFYWLLQNINPEETLFYVVSKSGKTPETISQFLTAVEWFKKSLPKSDDWKKHIVVSTDPEKGDLRELAKRFTLPCLDIPSAVGGRFSVLSSVGLFPATFAGLNPESFLSGARSLVDQWEKLPVAENPVAKLARTLACEAKLRPITVLMPYSSQLGPFSRWFSQLWGESLGKRGLGLTPYPAIGTTDQHSQMQLYMEGPKDKSLLFIQVENIAHTKTLQDLDGAMDLPSFRELANRSMHNLFHAEYCATRDALTKQGVPNATVSVECLDEFVMGSLFYFFEWMTLYAGAYLDINPFDQPGVEAAKLLTKRYLLGLGR